jgi:hypothetical protein
MHFILYSTLDQHRISFLRWNQLQPFIIIKQKKEQDRSFFLSIFFSAISFLIKLVIPIKSW